MAILLQWASGRYEFAEHEARADARSCGPIVSLWRVVPRQWVPSIADVALYPYTRMAPLGGIDLQLFSNLEPWPQHVERLRGYQRLFPYRLDMNPSPREVEAPIANSTQIFRTSCKST